METDFQNILPNAPNYYQGKKKKNAKTNHDTYLDYYYRLKEYVINMFEWENLPDSVDQRFIELTLCEKGYLVYFNDDVLGNLALTCMIGGLLDVYRIPTFRRAYATNGYQKNLDNKNSVLIFNNYLHTPSLLTIRLYAKRLSQIERAIDVNVKGQRTPLVILCNDKDILTMKNFYQQYDENEPFIFGGKKLDLEAIHTIPCDVKYVADKLNILKRQIWQEALTFCGVENMNTEKKERLVTDEIVSNLGSVQAQRLVMLNARQDACEKINKMFGTNINVKFREDLSVYTDLNKTEEGGEDNGEIYN